MFDNYVIKYFYLKISENFALNHIYLKSVPFLISFQNILYIGLYLEIKKTALFVKCALVVSLCERYWYKQYAGPIWMEAHNDFF